MIHYRFLIFFLAFGAMPYAHADDRMHLAIQVGPEYFKWQEFESAGPRLLEETGLRFGVGAAWDNFQRSTSGLLYGVNGRFYFGTVNYDGQTQSGTPVETDTGYFGINVEAQGGYRFGSGLAVDLLGAVGIDDWTRSIEDSRTASGQRVIGYDESYTILYIKLGPGIFHDLGSWQYRFHVGVKYPVYTYEYVYLDDGVELSPEPRTSYFARLQADFGNKRRFRFGAALYYDSFRFDQSDPEILTSGGVPFALVHQPESHMDTIGVQVRVSIF